MCVTLLRERNDTNEVERMLIGDRGDGMACQLG